MTTILIDNATLIDGTGAAPIPNAAVLIKDGRIHAVGRADSIPLPDTAVTRIDADGHSEYHEPGCQSNHVGIFFSDSKM